MGRDTGKCCKGQSLFWARYGVQCSVLFHGYKFVIISIQMAFKAEWLNKITYKGSMCLFPKICKFLTNTSVFLVYWHFKKSLLYSVYFRDFRTAHLWQWLSTKLFLFLIIFASFPESIINSLSSYSLAYLSSQILWELLYFPHFFLVYFFTFSISISLLLLKGFLLSASILSAMKKCTVFL